MHSLGLAILSATIALAGSAELTRRDGSRISVNFAESEVARLMDAASVPGLSVAVINEGPIVYANGFGTRDAGQADLVDADTVFGGLSFSKTVFAYLVTKLVDRGDLDLDRPLHLYLDRPLPEYEFYRDLAGDDRYRAITARMALSHTTGWPNWRWFTEDDKLTFWFEPGERFSYSGEGFAYLQLVVEHITGRDLPELARELVFQPLEMTRSGFLWEDRFEGNFASSHDDYGKSIGKDRKDEASAAGSIQTTASDYARFLLAVAKGEGLLQPSGRALLTPQVALRHSAMFGPGLHEETDANAGAQLSWGVGFGLVHTPYGWAHFHTGNDRGCSNYMVAYPDRGIAVALLGNTGRLETVAHELTRVLIGDEHSPFGFLGYDRYDSPIGEWIRLMLDDGLAAAKGYYESLGVAGRRDAGLSEEEAFARAGTDLLGFRRFDLASDFFTLYLEHFPASARAHDAAADAEVERGQPEAAVELLERGRELAKGDPELEGRLAWRLDWARAISSPHVVPLGRLERYAGEYGPRRILLRAGILYYFREGLEDAAERRLIPLSEDTFVFADFDSFRLRFETDDAGSSLKAVGLYLDGRTDETLRTR